MVLSACVGVAGGGLAGWVIYQRVGPVERVVTQPIAPGSGGEETLGSIAGERMSSLVTILTQPTDAEGILAGPHGFANGFVASSDGLIITSARAVEGATRLRVAMSDGRAFDALVAGLDAVHGVVALRAPGARELTPLAFAARAPRPGDLAIALARPPLGAPSVLAGTVSATGRSLPGAGPAQRAAADTLSIGSVADPAGEGGPLLDGRGQVIGVVTQSSGPAAGGAGGGAGGLAALSGRAAAQLIERTGRGRSGPRASLGLEAQVLDPVTAAAAQLPPGALIRTVAPNGPAAQAGLARSDIVTAVDGVPSDAEHPLDAAARGWQAGQRLTLSVVSLGESRNVAVTVGTE